MNFNSFEDILGELRENVVERLGCLTALPQIAEDFAYVHVRLGDYVSSPEVACKMASLNSNYYADGMRTYEQKHWKAKWILCSNEPKNALELMPKNMD
ncbi:alpha-1,2-fucosyltransferase, partial [Falsihalocynthiibacter sp. S25ZX9]|uniref:alpha-1,2-fucosyltransferase n=1 Tax=Falsihalocynthiibacter sp. S25ZX9 TaxID=3240870 RepID=UPI00350ECE0A